MVWQVAIIILDSDGNRVLGKYYSPPHLSSSNPHTNSPYIANPQPNPYPTVKDQKTSKRVCLRRLRSNRPMSFSTTTNSSCTSKESMWQYKSLAGQKRTRSCYTWLWSPLETAEMRYWSICLWIRFIKGSHSVEKRFVLENYDLVAICIDEIYDDGHVSIVRRKLTAGLFRILMLRTFVLELQSILLQISQMSKSIYLNKAFWMPINRSKNLRGRETGCNSIASIKHI